MGTIPTPPTISPGAATSAQMNQFRDAINFWASPPACSATQATAQSVANITYTALNLDGELYDNVQTGDTQMHDTVTNNSRITIRTAGKYQISGAVGFVANATGIRKSQIFKNGLTGLAEATTPSAGAGVSTTCPVGPQIVSLAVGDYIELRGYQSSGGALNTDNGTGVTYLTAILVSS